MTYFTWQFLGNGIFDVPIILTGYITGDSHVYASICELKDIQGENNNPITWVGDANMSVLNIVPQDDGTLTIRVNVDWGSPLFCQLKIIVASVD